jgi:RHH-type rel operon transcriptional repressor/antitoxin RelB
VITLRHFAADDAPINVSRRQLLIVDWTRDLVLTAKIGVARTTLRCYTCNTRISMEVRMLAIRLPEDIEARLTALAAKTGRTKTFYAKEAILEHLDDMEDKYLAISRLENPSKRWTLDEMEQDFDLAS